MSYNFKKIMDLDLVTEVPEGANVLIETDGATKRLPSTAIKSDDSYSKEESDAKYLTKDSIATPDLSENDPTKPGYVKNRTHYEETTVVNEPLNITWNGNTEGLVMAEGIPLYKISDLVLTEEQLKACTAAKSNGQYFVLSDIWDDRVADGTIFITEDLIGGEFGVFVARKDGAIFSPSPDASLTFPESGIYFGKFSEEYFIFSLTSTEPVEHTKTVVHKLDPKFLPDGYPYEEVVVTPVTAFEFELEATDTDNPHKWFRHEEPPFEFDDLLAVLNSENVGRTVCVNYDGVQYMCDVHMDNHFSWYIGNSGLMKNFDSMFDDADNVLDRMKDNGLIIDTGEPFLFLSHSYYTVYNYIVASDTNPHNVEVGFCDTVVKKLDKKFLPDDIGGGIKYVTIGMDDNDNYTASATYDEIYEWIKSGIDVKCVYGNYVLPLANSPATSEISPMTALASAHYFESVQTECEDSDSWVTRSVSINQFDEVNYYEKAVVSDDGESDVFFFQCYNNGSSDGTVGMTATSEQIRAAIDAGKYVYCCSSIDSVYMHLTYYPGKLSSGITIYFSGLKPGYQYSPAGITANARVCCLCINGTKAYERTFNLALQEQES